MDEDCDCGAGVQPVDLICGGFPCQDVANGGKRAGIEGERSGLWAEFARLVGILRPRFVFVENVAGLASRGLGRVLGDLAALGFDAEWTCVRASDAGGLHERRRIFILANARESGKWSSVDPRSPVAPGDQPIGGSLSRRRAPYGPEEWRTLVGGADAKPAVGRIAHGLSARLARRHLAAYGDAVCPQQGSHALRLLLSRQRAA